MKLILAHEVTGLGTAGDVVEVKDGYARNFLLPRGDAIAWSAGGAKQIDGIRRARSTREVRDLDHAQEIKQALEASPVKLPAKAGETGRLFGSVTDKDVAAGIKAATGLDVDRHDVTIAGHIKQLGSHTAKVSLSHQVVATVSISVIAAA